MLSYPPLPSLPALRIDRFLPTWCAEHVSVQVDEESGKVLVGKRSDRHPELVVWQLAWDHYTLAAAALEQMPWKAALEHKAEVMEVGLTAHVDNRSPLLGVFYDEQCRPVHYLLFVVVMASCPGHVVKGTLGGAQWEAGRGLRH